MKNNNIFIIVVTFNGLHWSERCFGSLQNSEMPLQIIVVDNCSTDGTVMFLQNKYPEITLFLQTENLGFGKANNIGIKYALENGADYVFLLNQDAWIERDTIQRLLEVFEQNSEAGIVAPLQLTGKGEGIDLKFLDTYLSHGNTPFYMDDMYFNRTKTCYETQLVNAAAWLVSRKCVEKVGGFDTLLFYHYGEDWNYCQRVQYHGFKIFIAPQIIVFHDREERNGKFTPAFENRWNIIKMTLHLANILLPENDLDDQVEKVYKKYRRNVMKSILSLKFNRLKILKEQYEDDQRLFRKIKTSRDANKKGENIWL
jgi:GT2 family glycosyltransferase